MPADLPDGLPASVRDWAQQAAGRQVVDVTRLGGGITNTKWRLGLAGGAALVVRWADPSRWKDVGREHVRREALALRLLKGSGLPVPELVAVEGPTSLMTWRPGKVRLDPLGPDAVAALARVLVAVHTRAVPIEQRPPLFSRRGPERPEPPAWAGHPDRWRHALEILAGEAPTTPYGLLHRDFHFGNVLWTGDVVSGVVDWAETSWGPADLDVAHLCSDLAMLGSVPAAAAFRTAYVEAGGRLDPDPAATRYWQLSDIVGFLPDPAHILPAVTVNRPNLTADQVRRGLEDLLLTTLAG